MNANQPPPAVPLDVALQICAQIRAENQRKPYTIVAPLWCWGCVTFTGGTPEKMCGGVVACPQVVKRYTASQ